MKLLLISFILLTSFNANAGKLDVACYSGDYKFFHKTVDDVQVSNGYVLAEDKDYSYFLVGECVVKHPKK
jgi:hypothetical protein